MKAKAFTLVELLTVIGIIALLVGLLMPAFTVIRNSAKEAKQKAQLTMISLALYTFKNDYGDYPPSNWMNPPPNLGPMDYCGAQKLTEALLGRDLLGFHPRTDWSATSPLFYPLTPISAQNQSERKGLYLELATTNVFRLSDLYGPVLATNPLNPDTFLICDFFGKKKVTLVPGGTAKAGTPILYYRAKTSSKNIHLMPLNNRIYNAHDNQRLVELGSITKDGAPGTPHPLGNTAGMYQNFYNYIRDPKVTAAQRPYRPDSFLLISAGIDGLYGTPDDISNFRN